MARRRRQIGAVTGMPSPYVSEIPGLQARRAMLPQKMQQQQQKKFQTAQIAQMEEQSALDKARFGYEQEAARLKKKAAKKAAGLEAGKLGMTIATGGTGAGTLGGVIGAGKSMITSPTTYGGSMGARSATGAFGRGSMPGGAMGAKGGFFKRAGSALGSMPIGSMIGGGLTGFGVGKMMGEGTSTAKKALAGFGAGGLMGLLGGGGLIGGLTGGLFGGIGGLFA